MSTISLPKLQPLNRLHILILSSIWAVLLVLPAGFAIGQAAPNSFADLVDEVSPSVVNITTKTLVKEPAFPQGIVPRGSPFEDFFREFQDRNGGGRETQRRASALGSGFVISQDGYIVTNNHVIAEANEIMVEFFSGEELPATIVGRDAQTDIALLKVEADAPLIFVEFGNSDEMRVGDWVIAMGNPLGQGFSVSAGIVSADNRTLNSGPYDNFIQTDAAINRGNSGGPLFNMNGDVIGVNTAILSPNGGSIGLGFSIASNLVSTVIDQLREFGETRRGWLGVRIQNLDEDIAASIDGLENTQGVLITSVPEGPAQDAGIQAGDVILRFGGKTIKDTRELINTVGNSDVGAKVDVVVLRDGAEKTIQVTLARREDADLAQGPNDQDTPTQDQTKEIADFGMSISNLTDERRRDLELDDSVSGVVVTNVQALSVADDKGIRPGDVILEIGHEQINTVRQFSTQLEKAQDGERKSLLLLLMREGNMFFVGLPLK